MNADPIRELNVRGGIAVELQKIWKSRFLSAVPLVALLTICTQVGRANGNSGDVYVMTNQPSGNAVMVFHRGPRGMLSYSDTFATGGNGLGSGVDPLGSQGALVLSEDQRLLFAVNAGSNSVSVFATRGDSLRLLNTVSSGGVMPVSVAVKHDLVYVLNAGGTPNISGFRIRVATNHLVPLPGSTRNLPGGAASGPAQVSFSPDGDVLVVTEKGTNTIDTFPMHGWLPGPGMSFPSSGTTPFGFDFGHDGVLVVSNASGGAVGQSTVSSYEVDEDGNLVVVSPALGDTQTAACWLIVPRNGRFAYTTNAGSNTISSFRIFEDGGLTLLNAVAASTGDGTTPIDMAFSGNSRYLYTSNGGDGTISGFRVGFHGRLIPVASASGVPSGAQGIAAR